MLSGCAEPAKVTGGGWIPSAETGKANFGFKGDSCSGPVTGQFNYHDKNAQAGGVKVQGEVVTAVKCLADSDLGSLPAPEFCSTVCALGVGLPALGVEVNYRSTNPNARGSGTAFACVADNGEGANATSDLAAIAIVSGPFTGYTNAGEVQGNIQEHKC